MGEDGMKKFVAILVSAALLSSTMAFAADEVTENTSKTDAAIQPQDNQNAASSSAAVATPAKAPMKHHGKKHHHKHHAKVAHPAQYK
jgi:hypothetical protein